jgi:hypothetical protein
MGLRMGKMDYLYGVVILNSFSIRAVSKMVRYLVKEFSCFETKQKFKEYSKRIISVSVFCRISSIVFRVNFRKENYQIKLLLIFYKVGSVFRGSFYKDI